MSEDWPRRSGETNHRGVGRPVFRRDSQLRHIVDRGFLILIALERQRPKDRPGDLRRGNTFKFESVSVGQN